MEEQVRAKHILVKHSGSNDPVDHYRNRPVTRSKDEAISRIQEIKARLDAGEEFDTVANQVSECRSAQLGGDLGNFGRGLMEKAIEDATYALRVGQLSEPVLIDSGVHLILRTA
jgi:NIMA-interacting peptidyl-prolyl cis-trans isomerase 1